MPTKSLRILLISLLTTVPAVVYAQGAPPSGPAPVATPPTGEAVAPGSGGATETDERPRGFIPQNSLAGSVGLLRMGAAEVGVPLQLRIGLHGEYFKSSSFLIEGADGSEGDHNTRLQGALTFGLSPTNYLEIFGAVLGSANRNKRLCSTNSKGVETCVSEAGRTDPEVIKAFGDLMFGIKLAYPLANGFSLGGELGLRLLSSVAGLTFNGSATSPFLGALATWNAKAVNPSVPLRMHLNVGMYFDNSYSLQDYEHLGTSRPSQLVSSFAYGLAKDRFRLALGIDAPIEEVAPGFALRPIAEYHMEYVTGSADEAFKEFMSPACTKAGGQPCRENKDQQWITLGLQGQMLHGLTVTAGVDLALRSVGFPYGPPLAPWNFIFGVGYPMDVVPRVVTRAIPVEKVVTVEKPVSEGFVAGRVTSVAGGAIEGALIGVAGIEHSRVATDADGSFRSIPLPAGPVELVVSATGYESVSAKTEVIAGQTINLAVTLAPHAPATKVAGHVSDDTGKPLVASVKLAGPQIAEGKADESGNFSVPVQAGQYVMRVEADQYLAKELKVSVAEGAESPVNVTLRARPAVSGVTFRDGKFALRQPISFKAAAGKPTAELNPAMPLLLDELVDVLINHPEIRQVRIEAHTDSSLPAPKAQELTDAQAKAVADYLVAQGIPQDRVVAVGMAAKKPLVPNLGKAGKMKNRRIELVVVQ